MSPSSCIDNARTETSRWSGQRKAEGSRGTLAVGGKVAGERGATVLGRAGWMQFPLHEKNVAQMQLVSCAKETLNFQLFHSSHICSAGLQTAQTASLTSSSGGHGWSYSNDGAHLLLALMDLSFLFFEEGVHLGAELLGNGLDLLLHAFVFVLSYTLYLFDVLNGCESVLSDGILCQL